MSANRSQRALIDAAAKAVGTTPSRFVLDAACRAAQAVLADRLVFHLGDRAYRRFIKALEQPAKDRPKLRRLLETKPVWEQPAG